MKGGQDTVNHPSNPGHCQHCGAGPLIFGELVCPSCKRRVCFGEADTGAGLPSDPPPVVPDYWDRDVFGEPLDVEPDFPEAERQALLGLISGDHVRHFIAAKTLADAALKVGPFTLDTSTAGHRAISAEIALVYNQALHNYRQVVEGED